MPVPRDGEAHGNRRTAKRATNPINALLNYLYTVAASECRLACLAVGLDPGLGYLHNDSPDRESLVYDLLEPVRPVVEQWTLMLLAERAFTAHDFLETPTGTCRIQPPLAQCLAATSPLWFKAVAAHAENVARIIGASSPYPVHVPTSLTASRMRAAQGKRLWSGVTDAEIRQTFPPSEKGRKANV